MELEEMKTVWSSYDKKLDTALRFNTHLARTLLLGKVETALNKRIVGRVIEALMAFALMSFIATFMLEHRTEWAFVLSGAVLFLFALAVVIDSVQQIALISMLDYTAPLLVLQKQIIKIRSHALLFLRITLLSLPLYMAYIVLVFKFLFGVNILEMGGMTWLWSQAICSLAFVPLSVWLWRNLTPENLHKAWVRGLLRGNDLQAALELLGEVEKFEE